MAVSVFTRPGKALFVVMNNSDADANVSMSPDWRTLGLTPPAALVDAFAEQARDEKGKAVHSAPPTISLDGGAATFVAPRRDFRAWVAR